MARQTKTRKKYLSRFSVLPDLLKRKLTKRKIKDERLQEERQKIKAVYDITEKQFDHYLNEAAKSSEDPAVDLFRRLEMRLDNTVFHLGFAASRRQARQLIKQGKVSVNNQKVDSPVYHLSAKDIISLDKDLPAKLPEQEQEKKPADLPNWLERKNGIGKVKHLPKKEEIRRDLDYDMVIKFYV